MEIREKIIDTAGTLFYQNGIRQVTMNDIAQSLGISKRTIYENFKDKDSLLTNYLIKAITNHRTKAQEIMSESKNVIEGLFKFGEFNQEVMRNINPIFFEDIKKYHPGVFKRVANNNGEFKNYEFSYTLLKRGVNEGIFIKEIDIEIANLFIHYSMEFFHEIEEQKKCSHETIWKSVHLPYLRGICTPKGLELIAHFLNDFENLTND